jgi:ribonuclease D
VAAWRERRAAELDVPVRFVLSDLAVLGIAQRPPASPEDLRVTRGVEDRHARGATGAEILAAVADGLANPVALPESNGELLERNLRPAVTLVSAWVSQLARDQEIDTSLLATRADLVELLKLDPEARLAHGWRAEMVGDDLRHLVEGRAALAFDGKGGLKLLHLE